LRCEDRKEEIRDKNKEQGRRIRKQERKNRKKDQEARKKEQGRRIRKQETRHRTVEGGTKSR
jgi:hypothetical protein